MNMTKIPAFTVCEITINPRNDECRDTGKGLKISSVKPSAFSLHSLAGDLLLLSPSLGEARAKQLQLKDLNPPIQNDIEADTVPFYRPVMKSAVVENDSMVKISNWGDPSCPQVDIPEEILLRFTNSTRVDWACNLLEVAIASGALNLLVFYSDRWTRNGESGYRAVPLIDVEILLAEVTHLPTTNQENFYVYNTSKTVDETSFRIQIVLCQESESVESGPPPQLNDFPIASIHTELAAAHKLIFNYISNEEPSIPRIWEGYLNATDINATRSTKRRKITSMQA